MTGVGGQNEKMNYFKMATDDLVTVKGFILEQMYNPTRIMSDWKLLRFRVDYNSKSHNFLLRIDDHSF